MTTLEVLGMAKSDALAETSGMAFFARRLALVLAVALGLMLLWFGAQVFLLVVAGILFAVLLRNMADALSRLLPLSKRWALAVVTLALLALIAGGVAVAAPRLAEQVDELREALPLAIERVRSRIEVSEWGTAAIDAAENPNRYLPDARALVAQAAGIFSTTLGALAAFLMVLFVGACLAVEPDTYTRGVLTLVPVPRRERAREILADLRTTLGAWLLAKTASMAVVGLLTGVGLWLLGVPLAFTLGLLAALLAFIPNIGPVIAAVPAVLLATLESPRTAIYVIVLYLGVQAVESYVITPLIERKAVKLPPALTVVTQLLLGLSTGISGVILAAPLTAAAMVLVRKLYVEDALGDRADP